MRLTNLDGVVSSFVVASVVVCIIADEDEGVFGGILFEETA